MQMSSTGNKHSPCAFTPNGATKEFCTDTSSSGARQLQACNACKSPFKCKPVTDSRPAPVSAYAHISLAGMVRPNRAPVSAESSDTPKAKPNGMRRMNQMWADKKATEPANIARMREAAAKTRPAEPAPTTIKAPTEIAVQAPTEEIAPVRSQVRTPIAETSTQSGNAPWKAIFKRIQVAVANAEFVKLDPAHCRPMKRQPREWFDDGEMDLLEISIREVGQVQPGLVRRAELIGSSDHEVLDGERRWRAVSRIPLPIYRAMCIDIDDEAAQYIVSTVMNFNRSGHTPLEIAEAMHRLYNELGMPMSVIAQLHGVKASWAGQMMGLVTLHPRARDLLDPRIIKNDRDRLPVTAAIGISKLDQSLQLDLANRLLRKEITLRGLRAEILRLGKVHGLPVKQRAVNRNHQFASFVAMGRNIRATASDLKALCNREDFSDFILRGDIEKVRTVLLSLNEAEEELLNSKRAIAQALAVKNR